VDGLLTMLDALLQEEHTMKPERADKSNAGSATSDLITWVWVTRQNVHVDRIACAGLIRRFIDRDARFKFVAA
jgi:ChrB, C-terminal domain